MKMWRKRALAMALSLSLMLGCAVCASAADAEENRLCDLTVSGGYTLTLLDADDNVVTSVQEDVSGTTKAVYKNVAKLKLEFTGSATEQYVVFLLNGESKVPVYGNIRYIDQTTGSTSVEFMIYPDRLSEPGTYYVTLSDTADYNDSVASFTVAEPPYTLGDVDMNDKIQPADALLALREYAELEELTTLQCTAADVDFNGKVTPNDALKILQMYAGLIEEF